MLNSARKTRKKTFRVLLLLIRTSQIMCSSLSVRPPQFDVLRVQQNAGHPRLTAIDLLGFMGPQTQRVSCPNMVPRHTFCPVLWLCEPKRVFTLCTVVHHFTLLHHALFILCALLYFLQLHFHGAQFGFYPHRATESRPMRVGQPLRLIE